MKNNKKIAIFAFAMCFVLSFAIVLQIRSLKSGITPFVIVEANNELRDEVLQWKEKYDNILKQLEKSESKLTKVRQSSVENDSDSLEKQETIKNNNEILGLTDVTGTGVSITVRTNQIDNEIKEDIDIIINELKNSGAEAISINDERIIFNSVVRCNENNIEVNGMVIQAPFEIQAIGDSKMIYNDLMRPGGYIELISGITKKIEIVKENKITIKKYNGKIESEFMKTI